MVEGGTSTPVCQGELHRRKRSRVHTQSRMASFFGLVRGVLDCPTGRMRPVGQLREYNA